MAAAAGADKLAGGFEEGDEVRVRGSSRYGAIQGAAPLLKGTHVQVEWQDGIEEIVDASRLIRREEPDPPSQPVPDVEPRGRVDRFGGKVIWVEGAAAPSELYTQAVGLLQPRFKLCRFSAPREAVQHMVRGDTCFVAIALDTAPQGSAATILAECGCGVPIFALTESRVVPPEAEYPSATVLYASSATDGAQQLASALERRSKAAADARLQRQVLVVQLGDLRVRSGAAGRDYPTATFYNLAEYQRHYGGVEVGGSASSQPVSVQTNMQQMGKFLKSDAMHVVRKAVLESDNDGGVDAYPWKLWEAVLVTAPSVYKDPPQRRSHLEDVRRYVDLAVGTPSGKPAEVILHGTQELTDGSALLADLGIGQEQEVSLAVRSGDDYCPRDVSALQGSVPEDPTMQVFVRPPQGETLCVDVNINATVEDLTLRAVAAWRGHFRPISTQVFTVAKEVLALYNCGHTDGVVLSIGDTYMRAVPIVRGTPVASAVITSPIAGNILGSELHNRLVHHNDKRKPPGVSSWWSAQYVLEGISEVIKADCCRVLSRTELAAAKDFARRHGAPVEGWRSAMPKDLKDPRTLRKDDAKPPRAAGAPEPLPDVAYWKAIKAAGGQAARDDPAASFWRMGDLPFDLSEQEDKVHLAVAGPEIWMVPERLFNPDIDKEMEYEGPKQPRHYRYDRKPLKEAGRQMGAAEAIQRCIDKCEKELPQDDLRRVCSAVVLDGGSTQYRGFAARLREELWPGTPIRDGAVWSVGGEECDPSDSARLENAMISWRANRMRGKQVPSTYSWTPVGSTRMRTVDFDAMKLEDSSPVTRAIPEGAHNIQPSEKWWQLDQEVVIKNILGFVGHLALHNPLHDVEAYRDRDTQGWRGGSALAAAHQADIVECCLAGVDNKLGIGPLLHRRRRLD